jgi:FkbM family methyltransferase
MSAFLKYLKKNGHLDNIHMTICNVGSRKIDANDEYGDSDWGIFAPNLSIYGFDADADACEEANLELQARDINWQERHIPLALSDQVGESTLYVTDSPMCSSLYPPVESYLERFNGIINLMKLDFSIGIETTTLDKFFEEENIPELDFLQIDVQGADLLVLQGAKKILEKSTLAIQVEVEFSPLYRGQPLFADIDIFLRSKNFSFFDFNIASGRRIRNASPICSSLRIGQLLWADAIYMKDLLLDELKDSPIFTPEKLLKLACISDILYFPDYSLELMKYITLNFGSQPQYNLANSIIESLAEFPNLIEEGLNNLSIIQDVRNYADGDALKLLNS